MATTALTRELIVFLLEEVVPAGSDFEALLLDFFPAVYRNALRGTSRSALTDALVAAASLQEIADALEQVDRKRYQRGLARFNEPPAATKSPPAHHLPSAQKPAAEAPALTRPQLRQLLRVLFEKHQEFVAFVLDYFPQVNRHFMPGMDRISCENLLLTTVETQSLLAALSQAFPEQVAAFVRTATNKPN